MKRKFIFLISIALLITITGCKSCPRSCGDNNDCTIDTCSSQTDFSCVHEVIKPCNGNNICEQEEINTSADCPGCATDCPDCADYNQCTLDTYNFSSNNCEHTAITPCCGNKICETSENYSSCNQDCQITANECLIFDKTREGNITYFSYKYHLESCKTDQILFCRDSKNFEQYVTKKEIEDDIFGGMGVRLNIAYGSRVMCLLNLAFDYNDSDICNYLTNSNIKKVISGETIQPYDEYWYCMAGLKHGQSACSHIKSDYWLKKCLDEL